MRIQPIAQYALTLMLNLGRFSEDKEEVGAVVDRRVAVIANDLFPPDFRRSESGSGRLKAAAAEIVVFVSS